MFKEYVTVFNKRYDDIKEEKYGKEEEKKKEWILF